MIENEFNKIWNKTHKQTEKDLQKEAKELNTNVYDLKMTYYSLYEELKSRLVDKGDDK